MRVGCLRSDFVQSLFKAVDCEHKYGHRTYAFKSTLLLRQCDFYGDGHWRPQKTQTGFAGQRSSDFKNLHHQHTLDELLPR